MYFYQFLLAFATHSHYLQKIISVISVIRTRSWNIRRQAGCRVLRNMMYSRALKGFTLREDVIAVCGDSFIKLIKFPHPITYAV